MTDPSHRPSGSEPTGDTGAHARSTSGVAPTAPTGHADEAEHESHGHSTAAWTAVGIILVGSLVMSFAVIFPSVLWFVIGAVIVVAGIASGKVLAMAGYGAKASTRDAAHADGAHQAELPGRSQHDSGTQ